MSLSRRGFIKLTFSTLATLAAGLEFEMERARAAALALKLTDTTEFPSTCHFCSGGCGLILHVRGQELINLEGDPDHPTNKGSLCPKGAALGQVRGNPQRILKPLYRPAGKDQWQEISWESAIDKIAGKIKSVRDNHWNESLRATDALGMLGSAEVDNEECYIMTKFIRLMGSNYNEHQARI